MYEDLVGTHHLVSIFDSIYYSRSDCEKWDLVISSKSEAGLLKPYNYVKGYARLSRWMDRKCDNATLGASSELT